MWSSYTAFNPSVLSFVISDLSSLQKENTFLEIVNFIYIGFNLFLIQLRMK